MTQQQQVWESKERMKRPACRVWHDSVVVRSQTQWRWEWGIRRAPEVRLRPEERRSRQSQQEEGRRCRALRRLKRRCRPIHLRERAVQQRRWRWGWKRRCWLLQLRVPRSPQHMLSPRQRVRRALVLPRLALPVSTKRKWQQAGTGRRRKSPQSILLLLLLLLLLVFLSQMAVLLVTPLSPPQAQQVLLQASQPLPHQQATSSPG